MRKVVCIKRHGNGLRVFVCGQRLHHGVTGIATALTCIALHRKRGAVIGAVLMLHDIHDWRVWFARELP